MCSTHEQTLCVFVYILYICKGTIQCAQTTEEKEVEKGGEAVIMRDNESVGGGVPENTKWA